MIDFKKHPELKIFYHPESESYFIQEPGEWQDTNEGLLCHEVELKDVPQEIARDLMSGFVIKCKDFGREFHQFVTIAEDVNRLNSICQNNMVIKGSDLSDWVKEAFRVRDELNNLIATVARKIK